MPRTFVRGGMPCKLLLLLSGLAVAGALSATASARIRPGPCGHRDAQAADGDPCRDRKVGGVAAEVRRGRRAGGAVAGELGRRGARRDALPSTAWFVLPRQARSAWQQSRVQGRANLLHVEHALAGPPDHPSLDDAPEQASVRAESAAPISSDVVIAPASQIALVYVVLYGPLAGIWLGLHRLGAVADYYTIMLPITLVALLIGFDTANQSLSALTDMPVPITAVHALSLWFVAAVWCLAKERRQLASMDWRPLKYWPPVMVGFCGYQMMNHLVSYNCSLSERIIFLNLCPVVSLVLEVLVMPISRQPQVSFASKCALLLMAVGTVMFAADKADFTRTGFMTASIFILVLIPYRLIQRWSLTCCCQACPVGLLASLDGLALFTPSAAVVLLSPNRSTVSLEAMLRILFSEPSIAFVLFLTMATFIGIHVCGLLMLRVGTATSLMVFSNMANFILLALSILLFNEDIIHSGVLITGLMLSLCSGVWYSVEVRRKELEVEGEEQSTKAEASTAGPLPAGYAAASGAAASGDAASLLGRINGG